MDKHPVYVTKSSLPPYEEFIDAIKPLWESRWITNMGKYHCELENRLKEYLMVPELSLMVNGHMALELTIQAMDFPKGSEIITTPFTFISTTHAIIRNGLVPVFCDIKPSDCTIDESGIEELITEKTAAILPVHVYGNLCNVEAIEKIAFKYNLRVIYDAAHAFGETKNGIGAGNFGDASIFSFHATKVFNTVEGGAVAFKNRELYERLYNLKNFGIRSPELVVSVGANAKLNELQAVMGLCNLKYVSENIARRKAVTELYRSLLCDIPGVGMMQLKEDTQYNFSYFPIIIDDKRFGMTRNELFCILEGHGIFPRKYFYPITSRHACFKNKYKNIVLENAEYISERVMLLPLYPDLEEETVRDICRYIKEARKK